MGASCRRKGYRSGPRPATAVNGYVPMDIMHEYIAEAGTSPKGDGTVRHYHVLVSTGARPELFHHGKPTRTPVEKYLAAFRMPESKLEDAAAAALNASPVG